MRRRRTISRAACSGVCSSRRSNSTVDAFIHRIANQTTMAAAREPDTDPGGCRPGHDAIGFVIHAISVRNCSR
jgi:hypothetical protein